MAAWIVIMFVGILMHELGHALTARAFRAEPAISLHGLGGVTVWQPREGIGPAQAGPHHPGRTDGRAGGGLPGADRRVVADHRGTPAYQVV